MRCETLLELAREKAKKQEIWREHDSNSLQRLVFMCTFFVYVFLLVVFHTIWANPSIFLVRMMFKQYTCVLGTFICGTLIFASYIKDTCMQVYTVLVHHYFHVTTMDEVHPWW